MIVGLHGKMRAGKNTIAERLTAFSPLPVVEVSFAAKLKESAAAILGVTVEQIEEWKNDPMVCVSLGEYRTAGGIVAWESYSQSLRSFLQRTGTEGHRDVFGADFWLDAALPLPPGAPPTDTAGLTAFNSRFYDHALYVVTDVRFQNEIDRVKAIGGIVVLVAGPETETGTHASEIVHHDDVDLYLDNSVRDDGFANLDRQLESLIRYVSERRQAA